MGGRGEASGYGSCGHNLYPFFPLERTYVEGEDFLPWGGAVMKKKMLVVGFDGATLDIAGPMMDAGKLPNMRRLRDEGASGHLRSTIPPNSSVAWSTFMTGRNPGGHGVFYFRERRDGTYNRPFITYDSIRSPSIWRILSDRGRKVGVVNVPLTYPPEPVNGFLVGGLLTPGRESVFTHPPSLHLDLIRALGEYPLDSEAERIFWQGNEMDAFTHMLYATKKVLDANLYLMDRFEWDFFMTVFRSVDLVQHRAWRFKIPAYRQRFPAESEKYGNLIEMCYEILDEYLGELIARAGTGASVCLMSDHGFGPIEGKFYVNRWLMEKGYLTMKATSPLIAQLMGIGGDHIDEPRKPRGFEKLLVAVGRRVLGILAPRLLSSPMDRLYTSMIDWSRTRAFSSMSGGEEIIIVNLRGREPQGIVEPGEEYENLRSEIIAELEKLRDPRGQRIVEKAYRREELYKGPYVELAPDIQFVTRDMSILPRSDLFVDSVYREPYEHTPALHRENGILFLHGEGIRRSAVVEGACLEDLAPTVLYMLGLPVPEEMDGKVLLDCFTEDFRQSNAVVFAKAGEVMKSEGVAKSYSPEEEETIRKTLQGLGYLS
jgi:predicted AlkP superfamily phosphohydrolase/phosphomutase